MYVSYQGAKVQHLFEVTLIILVQCHISIPPENVRKPFFAVFCRFQGV